MDGARPPRRDADGARPPRRDDEGARPWHPPGDVDAAPRMQRSGTTISLDPDVARVFRDDAAVNKALRLVIQLLHSVEEGAGSAPRPAPRSTLRRPGGSDTAPRRSSYQGSAQARGFTRRPPPTEEG